MYGSDFEAIELGRLELMTEKEASATRPDDAPAWRTVYICSAGRSGSTLTDMFLGGHSQAASLGEVNHLGKAVALQQTCACGTIVRECGHWKRVFDDLATRTGCDFRARPYAFRLWDAMAGIVIDRNRQTPAYKVAVALRKAWLDLRHRTGNRLPLLPSQATALRNKIALYESIARQWGKQVMIDSSKNAREAVELYRHMPGRVKIILLTRDGRGVFLSSRTSKKSQSESLAAWLRFYRRALPLLEKQIAPDDLLTLRYEDFATDPENTGRRLCEFSGLDFEASMLDLAAATRHIVNGNDTRFATGKGIRLDERWRNALVGDDLAYFQKHGSKMNERLGYS
jgi:hypothetical protein